MCITVTPRGEVLDPELRDRTGLCTEIRDIDDHEFLCHFRIQECKNKVRAAKAGIYYCYIVGKCVLL